MHSLLIGIFALAAAPVDAPVPATPAPVAAPATPTPPAPAAPAAPAVPAAPPPDTDIHVVEIARAADGAWTFGTPRNLTARAGYDNQPAFAADGAGFFYTSDQANERTDVHFFALPDGGAARVVATPLAEYSPTPVPDGSGYTAVVVEADGTQRLWKFKLDGSDGYVLLPELKGVGYHAWIGRATLALFVLGDDARGVPQSLHLVDVGTGVATKVAERVGRSLHRVPGTERLSYVDRTDPKLGRIVSIDAGGGAPTFLVEALPEVEDFCWLPDGSILMGQGAKFYRWSGEAGTAFAPVADFGDLGGDINRCTVSADGKQVAFVVTMRAERMRGIRG